MKLLATQAATVFENARLFESATYEGLTGLYRREAILEILDREWSRSVRYDRPLAVALADLDRFKWVNDRSGHLVGDLVLQRVAAELKGQLRETDFIGRFGGEEFLLVLPEIRSRRAPRSSPRRSARTSRSSAIPLETARCSASPSRSVSRRAPTCAATATRERARCSPPPTPRSTPPSAPAATGSRPRRGAKRLRQGEGTRPPLGQARSAGRGDLRERTATAERAQGPIAAWPECPRGGRVPSPFELTSQNQAGGHLGLREAGVVAVIAAAVA